MQLWTTHFNEWQRVLQRSKRVWTVHIYICQSMITTSKCTDRPSLSVISLSTVLHFMARSSPEFVSLHFHFDMGDICPYAVNGTKWGFCFTAIKSRWNLIQYGPPVWQFRAVDMFHSREICSSRLCIDSSQNHLFNCPAPVRLCGIKPIFYIKITRQRMTSGDIKGPGQVIASLSSGASWEIRMLSSARKTGRRQARATGGKL